MFRKSRLQPVVFLSIIWSSVVFAQEASPLSSLNPKISNTEAVNLLMAQIAEVEHSQDSFDPKLGELSFELGLQLSELSLNEDALSAFQRSDQNMKVREGLYSENREPLIRKIYEQHIELKDWESAGSSLENIAWLKARNFDSKSLEFVGILQEMVLWDLAQDYYRESLDDTRPLILAAKDLEKIYEIYTAQGLPIDNETANLTIAFNHRAALRDELTEKIGALNTDAIAASQILTTERACHRSYPDNRSPALDQVQDQDQVPEQYLARDCVRAGTREIEANTRELNYGVSENQSITSTAPPILARYLQSISRLPQAGQTGNEIQYDINPDQMYFARSYSRGKEVLVEQMDAWSATDDIHNTLDSMLNLADWYLLFGFDEDAMEIYSSAWDFAEENDITGSMHMLSPKPISTAGIVDSLAPVTMNRNQGEAIFSLTINAYGHVERIELLETDVEDQDALARLIAEMSMSKYRPILRDGFPVADVAHRVSRKIFY